MSNSVNGSHENTSVENNKKSSSFSITTLWFIDQIFINLRSAVTVSLVNVPLSISLAIAGGGTPASGVVSGFWSGLAAAIFGGSEFNIVGPTGALSGTLSAAAEAYGQDILVWLSIWTGVLTFLIWIFRVVDYFMFIPTSVVHGFTLGVAIIIGLGQVDSALGMLYKHTYTTLYLKVWESICHIPDMGHPAAPLFFIINFAVLLSLLQRYPKYPWAVVITIVGIIVGYLSTEGMLFFTLTTLEERYGEVELKLITFPRWIPNIFSKGVISQAVTVTLVAVLETLISARMADVITKTDHNRQQEVFGIAMANLIGGVCGGVPATAALARTSLNIKSGAKSRVSAIMACGFLLLISALLLPYFKYIPMSTIAAILFVVAYRMVDFEHLHHLWRYDRQTFYIAMATAFICIVWDTMTGLIAGSVVSLLFYTKNISKGNAVVKVFNRRDLVAKVDLKMVDESALRSQLEVSIAEFKVRREQAPVGRINSLRTSGYQSIETTIGTATATAGHSTGADGTGTGTGHSPKLNSFGLPVRPLNSDFVDNSLKVFATPAAATEALSEAQLLVYLVAGQLTYINSSSHIFRTKKLLAKEHGNVNMVVIALENVWAMDIDGVDALHEMIELYSAEGNLVLVSGLVRTVVRESLKGHEFFEEMKRLGLVYQDFRAAVNHFYPDLEIQDRMGTVHSNHND